MNRRTTLILVACAVWVLAMDGFAASPKREMRATWLTSVANIDWPKAGTVGIDAQKKDLVRMLDSIQSMNMNTVFFHIRPACDALYRSVMSRGRVTSITGAEWTPGMTRWRSA